MLISFRIYDNFFLLVKISDHSYNISTRVVAHKLGVGACYIEQLVSKKYVIAYFKLLNVGEK